jgi:selenocysteine lyase/cysteine desulfurase
VAGGPSLIHLPVDDEGFFDLVALEQLLREHNEARQHGNRRITLVTVCGASNVQGTFNDLAEISRLSHKYGARLLVDGAQMVAHRAVDLAGWDIDYFAFSGHKIYAPFGAGALVARRGLLTLPDMAEIRASGAENVGGIAALAKALLLLRRIGFDVIQAEEQALTARALRGMATVPGMKVHGVTDPASPRFAQKGGVIAFDLGNILTNRIARALAERHGIGVRWGCHCAHLAVKNMLHIPRPVSEFLQRGVVTVAPGLSLPGVVRVSFGIENTEEDVDALIAALAQIASEKPGGASELNGQMDRFMAEAAARVYAVGSP